MNVIKMENWLPLFLQKHLERDRFLTHLFPLNVYIMNLSYSFISSRRTTKEWQLGCKDGSGGLWLVLHGFAKALLNMVGHSQQRKPHDIIYVCHRFYVTPTGTVSVIYVKTNKPLGHQNWCLPWIFGGGQDEVNFCCILLATVSDYFNSIFPWFGQNSEVKSASSAKEVDEYLSRHTLNQRFAGWFCLHIVPLVSVAQNSTKRMAIGPGLFAPDVGVNQVQWSIKQRKRAYPPSELLHDFSRGTILVIIWREVIHSKIQDIFGSKTSYTAVCVTRGNSSICSAVYRCWFHLGYVGQGSKSIGLERWKLPVLFMIVTFSDQVCRW